MLHFIKYYVILEEKLEEWMYRKFNFLMCMSSACFACFFPLLLISGTNMQIIQK